MCGEVADGGQRAAKNHWNAVVSRHFTIRRRQENGDGDKALSLLHRHNEVLHDIIFALRRVLAHVEAENAGDVVLGRIFHLAQAHFLADELLELRRVNLAQALEPRDLAAWAQLRRRLRRAALSLGEAKRSRLAGGRVLGSGQHEDCRDLPP